MWKTQWVLVPFVLGVATGTAAALPATLAIKGSDGEASVTLQILDRTILEDSSSWCRIRFVDSGLTVPFSTGDSVAVRVFQRTSGDPALLWNQVFGVHSPGPVDRVLDCSFAAFDAAGDQASFFAEAEVDKDECGTLCFDANPVTGDLASTEVLDDAREPDDVAAQAKPLANGATADLIARNDDWHLIQLTSAASVRVRVAHLAVAGRLDAALFDDEATLIANGTDGSDEAQVAVDALPPGNYLLRVAQRSPLNFNFYDIELLVTPMDCVPGAVESAPCGECGAQQRLCGDDGRWGEFDACSDEGVCHPGNTLIEPCGHCGTRTRVCGEDCAWEEAECIGEGACEKGRSEVVACGKCGTMTRTCDDTCQWIDGACEDEGDCVPASVELGACEGGERTRACSDACAWGEWGPCVPACAECVEPTPDSGTADVPTADIPTADIPTADVPSADIPTADVPTADIPTADIPTADVPSADIPAADIPTADVPTADIPTADVPSADIPAADIPTADVPTADLPGDSGSPVTKSSSGCAASTSGRPGTLLLLLAVAALMRRQRIRGI